MKILPTIKNPRVGDVYYIKHKDLWEDGEYQITILQPIEDWDDLARITVMVSGISFEPQFRGEYGFWDTIENFRKEIQEKRYKFLRHEKTIKDFNKV